MRHEIARVNVPSEIKMSQRFFIYFLFLRWLLYHTDLFNKHERGGAVTFRLLAVAPNAILSTNAENYLFASTNLFVKFQD
jgi:hypothetical protein